MFDLSYSKLLDLVDFLGQPSENKDSEEAIKDFAVFINSRAWPFNFNEQTLTKAADVFSKLPGDSDCNLALNWVLKVLTSAIKTRDRDQLMIEFNEHALAKFATALSKGPDVSDCEAGATLIAQALSTKLLFQRSGRYYSSALPHLRFREQDLADLADTFSKWPDNSDCKGVVGQIAGIIEDDLLAQIERNRSSSPLGPYECNEQALANLSDVFSKFSDNTDCERAIQSIDRVITTNLAYASSKWPDDSVCERVVTRIATFLSTNRSFQTEVHLNEQGLANLIDAFSKFSDNTACKSAIQSIDSVLAENILLKNLITSASGHGGCHLWDEL